MLFRSQQQETPISEKEVEQCQLVARFRDGVLVWEDNEERLFVPAKRLLRERIMVAAHQGLGGHRGIEVTWLWIRKRFTWPALKSDVEAFVRACLGCARARGGRVIPRAWLRTKQPEFPNDILHFDYFKDRKSTRLNSSHT